MWARQHVAAAVGVAIALASLTGATFAQDVSDANLKAAYIYRFSPFTEWPTSALSPNGPLTMCVVGDAAVGAALERTVKDLTVHNRPVVVAFGPPDRPPSPCHILYVSGVSPAQATRLIAGVRDVPVLTMSDLEGFNRLGGIAELFYESGQLRFAIRPDAVERSGLQLSSRLLLLSRPQR